MPSQTPCQTPCQTTKTIESHTVSYLDHPDPGGIYVNGNRTDDSFSLQLGNGTSGPCTPTSACTAHYTYDPRDRRRRPSSRTRSVISTTCPTVLVVKAGHKLQSDYDQANWLTDQIDSTLNQQVLNSFTPIGLESRQEIDRGIGSGATPLQTTSWSYFLDGKLSGLSTTVPGQAQPIEQHTVSYLDSDPKYAGTSGLYLDGNRTQDQYSIRPGGAAGSMSTRTSGTATYGYDPRDRLVSNNDGHGDATTYTLDGAGNIQTQSTVNGSGTSTVNNFYDPNNLNQLQKSTTLGGPTLLYWYDSLGRQQCVTDATGSRGDCNPSENTPANKPRLQDYKYDYLDRLQTYRTYSGGGNPTDEAKYVYDALNRTVQETEQRPSFPGDKHITQFSYLGLGRARDRGAADLQELGQHPVHQGLRLRRLRPPPGHDRVRLDAARCAQRDLYLQLRRARVRQPARGL